MNVTVIVVETFVESNGGVAEAADTLGNQSCACAVRVLAGVGTRSELRAWAGKSSGCHWYLLMGIDFRECLNSFAALLV